MNWPILHEIIGKRNLIANTLNGIAPFQNTPRMQVVGRNLIVQENIIQSDKNI